MCFGLSAVIMCRLTMHLAGFVASCHISLKCTQRLCDDAILCNEDFHFITLLFNFGDKLHFLSKVTYAVL